MGSVDSFSLADSVFYGAAIKNGAFYDKGKLK